MANSLTSPSSTFRHASFQGTIGVSRSEITPPVGIYFRNWGAAEHETAEAVHRPLWLSAICLDSNNGEPPLVIVDADLGWWRPQSLFDAVRERILHETGLPIQCLLFGITHTHSGPPLMIAEESLPGSSLLRDWMETFITATIRTIQEARSTMRAGRLEWAVGRCTLATHRDFPDPDADRVLCGFAPDAAADDTLLVGRVSDANGALRAIVVHYACHPTTLAFENRALSPDYIGAMRETVEQQTGVPAFFLLGACGELAPRVQYVADLDVADAHGRQLGWAALSTLESMEPPGHELAYSGVVESGAPLAIWKQTARSSSPLLSCRMTTVDIPLKDWPTADEFEQMRRESPDRTLQERMRRRRDVRRCLGDGKSFALPIHVCRIGEAVLVGTCCEAYSLAQIELRRRFPGRTILCMNLLNGTISYLPPADLYDQDIYPVTITPFARGAFEKVLEAMSQAIHDILEEPFSNRGGSPRSAYPLSDRRDD